MKHSAPSWDLRDLYASMEDQAIADDLRRLGNKIRQFRKKYEGKVVALGTEALTRAIREYESIQELSGKLSTYAYLVYAEQMSDAGRSAFYQRILENVNEFSTNILFFTIEINTINTLPDVTHYAPWLRDVRAFREHQLANDLEQLFHEKTVTGHSAWNRLFDETLADLRFPFRGKQLTCAEILNHLSSPDAEKRREAGLSFGRVLGENARLFAMITNVLAKDKSIEDKWRKFPRPVSSRNLSNYIEDEVVAALLSSVKEYYPQLSHRYYALKAKWMGKKKLDTWDRNAPLPWQEPRGIPWEQARDTVLESYQEFSPEMARIGKRFFDKNWIDAAMRKGKDSGAFSHPAVPSAHPYILMNYQGTMDDVMTLAHELGHGVHQVLSAGQGALMCEPPLTLAETASVFGEQLTFRMLLAREKNPARRKALIAGKVEDMLNTVVRQAAFCEFERLLHDERRQGEVPVERIGELWMQVQKESLGPAFRYTKEYRHYWAYIGHFIHAPFYVYAYAFGDCLVNALYARYLEAPAGFEKKYLAMLRAGGTLRHRELLAPFGLDASRPDFWRKGLDVISGLIDELEG